MKSVNRVCPNWMKEASSTTVFEDVNDDMFASLRVSGFGRALKIDHFSSKPPTEWLVQKKCADGALYLFDDPKRLFVIEHKSKLTSKEWFKAKLQAQGMYLNVKAMFGVVEIDCPEKYTFVVTFLEDCVDNAEGDEADIVLKKVLTGSNRTVLDSSDWSADAAMDSEFGTMELIKIRRDAGGAGALHLR